MDNNFPAALSNFTDIFARFLGATEKHDILERLRYLPVHMVCGNCFVSRNRRTSTDTQAIACGKLISGIVIPIDAELPYEHKAQFKEIVSFLKQLDAEIVKQLNDNNLILLYDNITVVADVYYEDKRVDYECFDGVRVFVPFTTAPEDDEDAAMATAFIKSVLFDLIDSGESPYVTILPENSNKEDALG